jgi:hypothetical protein
MTSMSESDQVRAFIKRYSGIGLLSTGAELVEYAGKLYNVKGSTEDPKAVDGSRGASWKRLFDHYADFSEANCYVTSPLPNEASNHPEFAVGGHMTPNSSGIVQPGGVTYLMPLCKWHNSTSRDGTAFSHAKTKMLKLTGFMEGDSAITFALRLENPHIHTILLHDPGNNAWAYKGLSVPEWQKIKESSVAHMLVDAHKCDFAVFEKRGDLFYIEHSSISSGEDNLNY